ncbi:pre-mRNA cleavage and polyadenylation factor (CPF) complex subunit [Puccinia graminis f. sp. tritici]|uniref:Polyadenylation factor subunit 2 n=2 Tax=Puccinia graminis f. sp. tritici TaxID=56615 RepID=A0A5B0M6C4_PUCGR|nr:pre-mRNA cleavage and polyadenylation factor (CPF) complex subunit [Puccinia graminis f. sp. tritici]
MNADTHPTSGDGDAQAEEPTAKPSPSSPIASSSTPNKASPIDLRPRMGRKQGWDAWRPGPYGPPTPPSMEKRLAEESALEMAAMMGHGRQDGRARKIRPRRTVDVGGSMSRWTLMRSLKTCPDEQYFIRPCIDHLIEFLPPQAYSTNPSTSILTKYVHTSTNKIRCPINIVRFTPDARRVLTGATSGEFTLWNALTFNFETILQAHDTAVRALDWSKSGAWLVSGDNNGIIKYFQPNMNNLQMFEGHKDSIRDISFSPNDSRFVSCGDDGVIKLWGFEERREERNFTGHGWDVKCVKWHPTKGLICSGGKDSLVKFWDPRIGKCLATLHGHKNSVQACAWNPNGHSIATASRDQLIKVFDIRMMKELANLRGHKKEVCSLAWHPIHHDLLTSGGSDGSIFYWCLPDSNPIDSLDFAHDSNVWSLDYHPLGHTLVSGSNDHTTRFWSRGRPGVKIANDRFHVGKERAREMGVKDEEEQVEDFFVPGLSNQFGHATVGSFFGAGTFGQPSTKDRNMAEMDAQIQIPPALMGGAFGANGPSVMGLPVPPRPAEAVAMGSGGGSGGQELPSIPGFGRAVDTSDNSLPGLALNSNQINHPPQNSGWRRGPLPSQEVAMGRDLGGFGGDMGHQQTGKNRWRGNKGNHNQHHRQHQNRWPSNLQNNHPAQQQHHHHHHHHPVGGPPGVGPGLGNSNNMHIDEFGREIPHQTSSNNKFK